MLPRWLFSSLRLVHIRQHRGIFCGKLRCVFANSSALFFGCKQSIEVVCSELLRSLCSCVSRNTPRSNVYEIPISLLDTWKNMLFLSLCCIAGRRHASIVHPNFCFAGNTVCRNSVLYFRIHFDKIGLSH